MVENCQEYGASTPHFHQLLHLPLFCVASDDLSLIFTPKQNKQDMPLACHTNIKKNKSI